MAEERIKQLEARIVELEEQIADLESDAKEWEYREDDLDRTVNEQANTIRELEEQLYIVGEISKAVGINLLAPDNISEELEFLDHVKQFRQ